MEKIFTKQCAVRLGYFIVIGLLIAFGPAGLGLAFPLIGLTTTTSATLPREKFRNRDIFLSATILALTGDCPTIEREKNLVVFVHNIDDKCSAAIATYLANKPVPVQNFTAAYKSLRQKMYAARG